MSTIYTAMVAIVTYSDKSPINTFLDTMLKLDANEIIDAEYAIPHGMSQSTALSCLFMLE